MSAAASGLLPSPWHGATGCHVTGISISEVGLKTARQSVLEWGVADRVRFLYGDGMSNGLLDASCDRVWVMESSHLMGDKAALLGECARVLRGGGKLVLCDIIAHVVFPIADVMRYDMGVTSCCWTKSSAGPGWTRSKNTIGSPRPRACTSPGSMTSVGRFGRRSPPGGGMRKRSAANPRRSRVPLGPGNRRPARRFDPRAGEALGLPETRLRYDGGGEVVDQQPLAGSEREP